MTDETGEGESVVLSRSFDAWVDIGAPRDEVFEALTSGESLQRWWTDDAQVESEPGGRVRYVWDRGGGSLVAEAEITEFRRPERFAVRWRRVNGRAVEEDGDNVRGARWPVEQVWELAAPSPGRTRLHLHDTGVSIDPDYDEVYASTRRGWVESLSRLKSWCEEPDGG